MSGKTAFFPRNDRPYGLKRNAFQTGNAHVLTRTKVLGRMRGSARGRERTVFQNGFPLPLVYPLLSLILHEFGGIGLGRLVGHAADVHVNKFYTDNLLIYFMKK